MCADQAKTEGKGKRPGTGNMNNLMNTEGYEFRVDQAKSAKTDEIKLRAQGKCILNLTLVKSAKTTTLKERSV